MRIYITLLLAFAFVLPLSAQTLVEKFRSEPNERWLNRTQLSQRTQGSFKNYFDPNVDFKGLSYVKNDSLIILWCIRFTNGTDIVDDFIIEGSKPDDNDLWGPVNLDGTGNYELAVWRRSAGSPTGSLSLFTMDAGDTELTAQIDGIVGFFDVDGDEWIDVLQYDAETRTLVVLGVDSGIPGRPAPPEEADVRSAYAPVLKYESSEGEALASLPYAYWQASDWDFNGDGTNEVILERTDAEDNPVGLRIVNGSNATVGIQIRFDSLERQQNLDFLGFYDVDGLNGKELYLSNGTVIDRNQRVYYLPDHFIPQAFTDVNGDNLVDVIGQDTLNGRIQIYGQSTATSVSEAFQQAIGLTAQPVYPNPARQTLYLPLHLDESMPVRLTLLDASGRLIRSLSDGRLPQGEHLLHWSVDKLNTGMYHLQIRTPKGMLSQKVVIDLNK